MLEIATGAPALVWMTERPATTPKIQMRATKLAAGGGNHAAVVSESNGARVRLEVGRRTSG